MDSPKRYHPALVTLHWLVALLVFLDLYIGYFYIRPRLLEGGGMRGTDPLMVIHMAAGIAILVLLLIRFIIRLATKRPVPADAGHPALNITARLVHYALYVVVFAMTLIGLLFAIQTNRFQSAFLGATGGPGFGRPGGGPPGGFPRPSSGTPFPQPGPGTPFPGGFGNGPSPFQGNRPRGSLDSIGSPFPLLTLHLYTSVLILILLAVHISAAFYHQFIRKDHLWSRMWYGAR
jgi:cytochrome b561